MTEPNEQTSGREEARRAYKEAQTRMSATDKLVRDARETFGQVAALHRQNHFVQKFGDVIRGARQGE